MKEAGAVQVQVMLYDVGTYIWSPMDTIQSTVFSTGMSFGYDPGRNTFIASQGNLIHAFHGKVMCGNQINLQNDDS